jgi:thiol-disulfide isomerase/thioredoxin
MMRNFVVAAILLGCCASLCHAQYEGTPEAKAFDRQGHDAEGNNKYAEALADYRKAIALDPNYADAYGDEINVTGFAATQGMPGLANPNDSKAAIRAEIAAKRAERDEAKEFEKLARRHPDKPIYLWALAQMYIETNPPKMEQYCRKAVAVDAHFGPGYECLAGVAYMRGDDKERSVLLDKATQVEPESATAASVYAQTLKGNPVAYKAATLALLEKFPDDPEAAGALYYYAMAQQTDAEKVEWLERLHEQFPPEKYPWSEMGMLELFAIEDRTDPSKARALAHEMARLKPQDNDWARYASYADGLATAEQEIGQGHPTEAVATLKSTRRPYFGYDMQREVLLNAQAHEASGGVADAYALLLNEYAVHPTDEVGTLLRAYAATLGKSAAEVQAAVWESVEKAATPSIPFALPGLDGGKTVSLADYRGHVVLVDFWFPACGPCRQSFPHLADLARKYKDRGVVVLAINGQRGQKSYVLPFLRSQGYDFVPLQADMDWDANIYHVRAYPTTLIIGADGREYFRPRLIDDVEERTAELEIDELLAHSGG